MGALIKAAPEVLADLTNKYQNWELVDPEKWVPDDYACVRVDLRGAGRSPNPRQPHFSSSPEAQAEVIIDSIERLREAAETSLSKVVRLLLFHTDIREFYMIYKVWERRLGGRPVPFSAVEVPGPLPVPGATVMMETWVYAA